MFLMFLFFSQRWTVCVVRCFISVHLTLLTLLRAHDLAVEICLSVCPSNAWTLTKRNNILYPHSSTVRMIDHSSYCTALLVDTFSYFIRRFVLNGGGDKFFLHLYVVTVVCAICVIICVLYACKVERMS